jgi:hypothetical protein
MTMHTFFENRVIVGLTTGCWLWKGSVNNWGYGRTITPQSTERAAHRISWDLYKSAIPEGLSVLHQCDTPRCCNPDHLFLGDGEDNMRDMAAKGRTGTRRGEDNPTAKLTREAVDIIRSNPFNKSVSALAREFGVSRRAIRFALTGETWK